MKFFNLVRVAIPTTGQGDVTFGVAVSDAFLTPSEAGAADADVTPYVLNDGNDVEIGLTTIGGSVTTGTRTVVVSKIGGIAGTTKLTLTGAATMRFISSAAEYNDFFRLSTVDTDGTLAANSDTKIASQKAVKTYADTGLALKISNSLLTTRGDLIRRGASAPERVALGAAGYALTSDGTDAVWTPQIGRNRLINAAMTIWQRATASVADDVYGFDRWNNLTQTAATTLSQLTDVENTTPFMMRITQGQASAQRFGLEQIIESVNCRDLRGQAVTLSARVRCNVTTTLRYAILGWSGTADTVTSDFVNDWTSGTYTAGNFFTSTSTVVYGTGSIALSGTVLTDITPLTVTLGSTFNNLVVIFWMDSVGATGTTLDIGKVQLEKGSVATAFEAVHYATDLARALRYLWQRTTVGTGDVVGVGMTIATTDAYAPIQFPALMRIAPAFSKSAAGDFSQWQANSAASACSALVAFNLSQSDACLHGTATGLAAAGGASLLLGTTAAGWIRFDAEL